MMMHSQMKPVWSVTIAYQAQGICARTPMPQPHGDHLKEIQMENAVMTVRKYDH